MQLKDTQDALNAFGKYVVQQSRSKLTQGSIRTLLSDFMKV
jgi:hypothetical protein